MEVVKRGWALRWRSHNQLDGISSHLMSEGGKPLFFRTREEARVFRKDRYGYILRRPDLRAEPHGWEYPSVVKAEMRVSLLEIHPK